MENQAPDMAFTPEERAGAFTPEERAGLYKGIFTRRDVRGQFRPDPIPDEVLSRLLLAAHHAPSVGFMQPWNFIVITDAAIKARVHADFQAANAEAAAMFPAADQPAYNRLKLEGIVDSPVNLCITCDRDRAGPVVLGRTHIPAMDLYSSVCAVQNLWLAARADGLGVGWVSILHPDALREILGIPPRIVPVAYLCLGYVTHFHDRPELQTAGWRSRLPLEDLVYVNRWEGRDGETAPRLLDRVRQDGTLAGRGIFPGADP